MEEPQAVDVAFYQLGVRLAQVSELHARCVDGSYGGILKSTSAPECVVILGKALISLRAAFRDAMRLAGLDASVTEVAEAPINECITIWSSLSELPVIELRTRYWNEPEGSIGFEGYISRVEEIVKESPIPNASQFSNCKKWFSLGQEICYLNWHEPLPRHEPPPGHLHPVCVPPPGPPGHEGGGGWQWGGACKKLMGELGVTEEELAPQDDANLDRPSQFFIAHFLWEQIERVLVGMKRLHEDAFSTQPPRGDGGNQEGNTADALQELERDADDELARLETETPSMNQDNGQWVRNKKAAVLEGLETATLRSYRYKGITNAESTLGRDPDGRIWRRRGTPKSHPWYLRDSLKSQRS